MKLENTDVQVTRIVESSKNCGLELAPFLCHICYGCQHWMACLTVFAWGILIIIVHPISAKFEFCILHLLTQDFKQNMFLQQQQQQFYFTLNTQKKIRKKMCLKLNQRNQWILRFYSGFQTKACSPLLSLLPASFPTYAFKTLYIFFTCIEEQFSLHLHLHLSTGTLCWES